MKFTTRFEEDLQEVGWEEHYLRYRDLKNFIKQLSLDHHNSKHHIAVNVETQVSMPEPVSGSQRLADNVSPSTLMCEPQSRICVECDAGERVFCQMVTDDLKRVEEFVNESLQSRGELFDALQHDVDLAVRAVKDEYAR
jgi:hypothetical protein